MVNKALIFIFLVVIFSCKQTKEQKTAQKINLHFLKNLDLNSQIDSIRQDSALHNPLEMAKAAFHLSSFEKKYKLKFDKIDTIYIDISINYFFDNTQKLLTIKRVCYTAVYFDVYKIIENSRIEKWLNIDYSTFNSPENIFFDVNGDSFKDFVVHWTPISGCCRRNIYDVYVYLPQKNTLSEKFSFINPTFYPKEKVIRGVGYGRPGEAELYKYKWNGLKIDTVEFIYNIIGKNDSVSFRKGYLKTKKEWSYAKPKKNGIFLKEVPKEYWSIQDYDWFSSFMPYYNYEFYDDKK